MNACAPPAFPAFALTFARACAILLAQTGDARVPVNFQEVMIPMRDGVRLQTVIVSL